MRFPLLSISPLFLSFPDIEQRMSRLRYVCGYESFRQFEIMIGDNRIHTEALGYGTWFQVDILSMVSR